MASASTSLAGSISARRLARSNTFAGGESGLLDAIEAWIERGAGNAERLRAVAARLGQLKEKAEAKAADVASAAELQPVKEDGGMADAFIPTNAPPIQEQVSTQVKASQDKKQDEVVPGCAASKANDDNASLSAVNLTGTGLPPAAQGQSTPIDLARYTEPMSLWAALMTGHVRLVKMSWLIRHAKAKGILVRRQELPEEAFISIDELKRMYGNGNRDGVLPIIAISFCWETAAHPDPEGKQLASIAAMMEEEQAKY